MLQVDREAVIIKAMQGDASVEVLCGSRAIFYEGCAKKEERRCLHGISHCALHGHVLLIPEQCRHFFDMFYHVDVGRVELRKESCSFDRECRGALLAHQQASRDGIAVNNPDQSFFSS